APQAPQNRASAPNFDPHFAQNIEASPLALLGLVVHVHGLDAHAAGSGHARQAHGGSTEEAGAQFLKLDIHGDGGILIEERAGFQHDALAGFEDALEDVAIAVEDQQAGAAGGDEAVHIHALAAEKD